MILVYDRDKKHNSVVDDLFGPLGMPYTVTTKLPLSAPTETPSAVVFFVDGEVSDTIKEYVLTPKRTSIIILIHTKDIVVEDSVALTCALVKYEEKDLLLTRSRLRDALTNRLLRHLSVIDDFTIYMARNGLYPGQSYYTNPKNAQHFLNLIVSKRIPWKKVLLTSRYNLMIDAPDVVKQENFIWVTDSAGPQKSRPVNLTFIIDAIIKKINELNPQIVYIDVFDFLMLYHPFFEIARGLEQIRSVCVEKNIYLIAVIGHSSMDPIQYGQITRYGEQWEPASGIIDED
ncbi:MAG: DUF835 domain-containing protein [Thermoplasmataceae archaeon]